jgi:hypothetical protein
MYSLISIVGVVLKGKENCPKWSRKIEHTLIFNAIWDGICDGDTLPTKPIIDKELSIWMNKNKKAYASIVSFVSEEVIHHIGSIKDSWGALKKLKDIYDSHSKLELIQLLLKLLNLDLNDNDPMLLASKIKSIMHNVDATGVKIDTTLTTFIKSLYSTYSCYIESIQASGQLNSLDCDSFVEKILFKTSFSSWREAWLLENGATCNMNFQRDFFEELNENVEGEA